MAERSTNTFPEILNKFLAEIGKAKALDDVGPPEMTLLVQLENSILGYRKQPVQDMQDSGQLPPDQSGGPSFLGQGGVPGVSMAPPQIPSSILRRLSQEHDLQAGAVQ